MTQVRTDHVSCLVQLCPFGVCRFPPGWTCFWRRDLDLAGPPWLQHTDPGQNPASAPYLDGHTHTNTHTLGTSPTRDIHNRCEAHTASQSVLWPLDQAHSFEGAISFKVTFLCTSSDLILGLMWPKSSMQHGSDCFSQMFSLHVPRDITAELCVDSLAQKPLWLSTLLLQLKTTLWSLGHSQRHSSHHKQRFFTGHLGHFEREVDVCIARVQPKDSNPKRSAGVCVRRQHSKGKTG